MRGHQPLVCITGVRRVGAAGRLADTDGGEERGAQRQLTARVRGHRRHQVAGGGRVPRHRLLRRHHRTRRARRRQPGQFRPLSLYRRLMFDSLYYFFY
jgi:hypothetical protein